MVYCNGTHKLENEISITIKDDRLATEFALLADTVQVRGPNGKIIGTFTPSQAPPMLISEEELKRRTEDRTAKTFTAAEVEAKLRELRCTQ